MSSVRSTEWKTLLTILSTPGTHIRGYIYVVVVVAVLTLTRIIKSVVINWWSQDRLLSLEWRSTSTGKKHKPNVVHTYIIA